MSSWTHGSDREVFTTMTFTADRGKTSAPYENISAVRSWRNPSRSSSMRWPSAACEARRRSLTILANAHGFESVHWESAHCGDASLTSGSKFGQVIMLSWTLRTWIRTTYLDLEMLSCTRSIAHRDGRRSSTHSFRCWTSQMRSRWITYPIEFVRCERAACRFQP